MRLSFSTIVTYVTRYRAVLLLVAIGLVSRLPLLSVSLDEIDSANFHNAITQGYNISWIRPQAPGYPVYVFIGGLVNSALNNPLLSLTLISAVLGSLSAVPFYLLARDLLGPRMALVGSILFLLNPLSWSFGESALSDVPASSFVVLAAWLAYSGRRSNLAFYASCVAMSLAIGVRQPNVSLLILLAFPVAYRVLVAKERPWRMAAIGGALFTLTSIAWFFPSVYIGSGGLSQYFDTVQKQWSTAVRPYDATQLQSPVALNLFYRTERFLLGYFVTYPWTGSDDKTPLTIALSAPWVFGIALFVAGFRRRNPGHVFVVLWMLSILYPILGIHFLPRYGLAQLPGFIMACLLGYRFLAIEVLGHPKRTEILVMAGIGTALVLYGIKYQSPVGSFESNPPEAGVIAGVFVAIGALVMAGNRWVVRRAAQQPLAEAEPDAPPVDDGPPRAGVSAVLIALTLLILPYGFRGYSLASIAHESVSPTQRLVEYVIATYDTHRVTPCWDTQTHSYFEAFTPGASPVGYTSINELYNAHASGQILLISSNCRWYSEIDANLSLSEVAHFEGTSPVWSKVPTVSLYATPQDRP